MKKTTIWQITTVLALLVLFINPISSTLQKISIKTGIDLPTIIAPVNAEEIYPMFTCPCCGQPLNKEDPCCNQMIEMIDYIDKQIENGLSRKDVIFNTTKKFGLDRLANDSDRQTMKKELLKRAPKNPAQISLNESKKDLGVVRQSEGVKTTEFTIKNDGKSELIIDKLISSCGCTSGTVVYKGEEGPRFYMPGHGHDTPDENWNVKIAPGEEAYVKVYYDPNVHKDLVGPVTRTITVHSNDPVNPDAKLTIVLDQEK